MTSSKEVLLFRQTLLHPDTCMQFQHFVSLKGDFLENDVLFWLEVQRYKVKEVFLVVFNIVLFEIFASFHLLSCVPPYYLSTIRKSKQKLRDPKSVQKDVCFHIYLLKGER